MKKIYLVEGETEKKFINEFKGKYLLSGQVKNIIYGMKSPKNNYKLKM